MKRLAVLFVIFLAGCTTMTVTPVDPSLDISYVCIRKNPAVIVSDFLPVVQEGFKRHGIATDVFEPDATLPENCKYILTYTAFQKWDLALYLSDAELTLDQDRKQIAHAVFHLKGGGGLALTKWNSVQTKMDPVIDELLKK